MTFVCEVCTHQGPSVDLNYSTRFKVIFSVPIQNRTIFMSSRLRSKIEEY
jgi:hypothetical protein